MISSARISSHSCVSSRRERPRRSPGEPIECKSPFSSTQDSHPFCHLARQPRQTALMDSSSPHAQQGKPIRAPFHRGIGRQPIGSSLRPILPLDVRQSVSPHPTATPHAGACPPQAGTGTAVTSPLKLSFPILLLHAWQTVRPAIGESWLVASQHQNGDSVNAWPTARLRFSGESAIHFFPRAVPGEGR